MATLDIRTGAVPEDVTVNTFTVAAVPTAVLPKLKLAALSVRTGVAVLV
jgi:hypothetical protein